MEHEIRVAEALDGVRYKRGGSPYIQMPWRVERIPAAKDISEQLGEEEAYAALMADIPTIFRGLYLSELEAVPNSVDGWVYNALYTKHPRTRVGIMDISGDSTGGNSKVTSAFGTIAGYSRSGGPVPNVNNGINWNGTEFEGTEVPAPSYKWSETWGFLANAVSDAYIQTCIRNTAGFNSAEFRGWKAGEVLFTGISQTLEVTEDEETDTFTKLWKITFNFEVSPNFRDIFVGGIGPIEKKGWDYLWVMYSQAKDTGTGKVISRPEYAYVQRVLNEFNFSVLGIGTGPMSSLVNSIR